MCRTHTPHKWQCCSSLIYRSGAKSKLSPTTTGPSYHHSIMPSFKYIEYKHQSKCNALFFLRSFFHAKQPNVSVCLRVLFGLIFLRPATIYNLCTQKFVWSLAAQKKSEGTPTVYWKIIRPTTMCTTKWLRNIFIPWSLFLLLSVDIEKRTAATAAISTQSIRIHDKWHNHLRWIPRKSRRQRLWLRWYRLKPLNWMNYYLIIIKSHNWISAGVKFDAVGWDDILLFLWQSQMEMCRFQSELIVFFSFHLSFRLLFCFVSPFCEVSVKASLEISEWLIKLFQIGINQKEYHLLSINTEPHTIISTLFRKLNGTKHE